MTPTQPTLLIWKQRAIRNIQMMVSKARECGVSFRPHFKTHQSLQVGTWFREMGVNGITVSSLDMATAFAAAGWGDITIAFPVNPHQITALERLSARTKLNLLVESTAIVDQLDQSLSAPAVSEKKDKLDIWIKVDCGYRRSGIPAENKEQIITLAGRINRSDKIVFRGLLTHAGHSYRARGRDVLGQLYKEQARIMGAVKTALIGSGFADTLVSVGDTPSCSAAKDISGVDEIRPGNFVFYDLQQLAIGSCFEEDLAAAVICPVVSTQSSRDEVIVYGGAVHLSKDYLTDENGKKIFGRVSLPEDGGWGKFFSRSFVSGLSQEHGIIRCETELMRQLNIGSHLVILPVHSCLSANLLKGATNILE